MIDDMIDRIYKELFLIQIIYIILNEVYIDVQSVLKFY